MICSHIQLRLLATEDPGHPAPEVEVHLAVCPACREWRRRLLQVEANVPRLPVPASRARGDFVAKLLNPSLPRPSLAPPKPRRAYARALAGKWRKVAAAVAAAILVACGAFFGNLLWQAWRQPNDQPLAQTPGENRQQSPDTLVARLVRFDLRLARASSAKQRVTALADLADKLQGETQELAKYTTSPRLKRLARLYGKVVRQGLVLRSRKLPAGERRQVLTPIAERLGQVKQEAERLARQRPGSAASLRVIARVAREGEAALRGLIDKEAT
jgi:hypothetical protein